MKCSNSSCKQPLVPSALSLALLAAALPLGAQAAGFVDDAKVSLGLRNFYINRNFVDP
ncbi:hypothetical protein SAMN05216603_1331, partial [Pseudomonas benzenivorans]